LKKAFFLLPFIGLFIVRTTAQQPGFRQQTLPLTQRVNDLLHRLTLPEKISLLGYRSRAVERLNIPAYNWWNEALHGVARAGRATVFPQAIGMAASFDDKLMYEVSSAISTEARAKYNLAVKQDRRLQYMGLTFWSPNINIFRDPRWGRGQETYGEDPFLTASMGVAFIKGLQGKDKRYLKTAACAKHFAVHSGPEKNRHTFNALVDESDLRETYLYAFKKLVDAGVESVMCAYNRVNGEPCCTGNTLLQHILREEWKFKGHVVTDCWALEDIWLRHKVMDNSVQVAAAAIKAGVNLDCSNMLQDDVMKAIEQKLLTEQQVDSALSQILKTQFKLGFYDDGSSNPYGKYGADSVANKYHLSLARKMAQQSMVLLKNAPFAGRANNILPLNKKDYGAIMVAGPNAASLDALLGNYHGVSDKAVNFVEGITAAVDAGTRIEYDQGCDYNDTTHFGGIWAASNADVTIAVVGYTAVYEGEDGDAFLAKGGGDKTTLSLPASHIAFLRALRKGTKTPLIAVVTAGSAVDIAAIEPYADAIILAWYPGEQGGHALADILFGKVSPSGRLPVTFYSSTKDLPSYDDYSMKGKTYRYYNGKAQYPFGFGLSYSNFQYTLSPGQQPGVLKEDAAVVKLTIKNTGNVDADDVVQLYVKYPSINKQLPLKELKAFQRISLKKGQQKEVTFRVPMDELKKWDARQHQWILHDGEYRFVAGSNSNDEKISVAISVAASKKPGK
jgi:beta-glucosidase